MTDRTIVRRFTETKLITRQSETPARIIVRNLGPAGDEGDDGSSAYAVAVSEGFVGTEAEWLDSLVGPAGAGVATGGTVGQFLRKQSGTNYDTAWAAPATSEVTGLDAALAAKIPATEKGAANGVASLDGTGKVPTAQLPIAAALGSVTYQGTWNATTNSPTIPAAAVGNKGFYYRVATAGSTSIDGVSDWNLGDWIVSDGVIWQKVDNTDPASVGDVPGLVSALALKADQTALDAEGAARIAGDVLSAWSAIRSKLEAIYPLDEGEGSPHEQKAGTILTLGGAADWTTESGLIGVDFPDLDTTTSVISDLTPVLGNYPAACSLVVVYRKTVAPTLTYHTIYTENRSLDKDYTFVFFSNGNSFGGDEGTLKVGLDMYVQNPDDVTNDWKWWYVYGALPGNAFDGELHTLVFVKVSETEGFILFDGADITEGPPVLTEVGDPVTPGAKNLARISFDNIVSFRGQAFGVGVGSAALTPGEAALVSAVPLAVLRPPGSGSVAGAASGSGFPYTFSSSVASGPGAGTLRLGHASPASATFMYISDLDGTGEDLSAVFDSWDDFASAVESTLVISKTTDPTVYAVYHVTGVVAGGGYHLVAVAYVTGAGSFTDGDAITVEVFRSDLAHVTALEAVAPTTNQKAALAGTGTPSGSDKYVNDSDSRMTNARTPTAHTHPESEVTNLVTDLAGKIPATEKGAASGVATLDVGGKVPSAQLPAVALVKPTNVADLAARLALTAEAGDVAVQNDTSKSYMLKEAGDPTIDGDWIELKTPVGAAPAGSPYVTFGTDPTLSNERVVTDTPTIAWDIGIAGQVKANVPDDTVSNAKLANVATATLKGRSTAGTGDPEDLTVSQVRTLLGLAALALLATVDTAQIDARAVTYAKIQAMATAKLLGRSTAGSGDIEELTASQARTLLALVIGTDVQAWSGILDALVAFTGITDGQTVKRNGSSYVGYTPAAGAGAVQSKTANYTALTTDGFIFCSASGGAFTITLPAVSGNSGLLYQIKKTDSSINTVTVDANASETIDGALTYVLRQQYESVTLVCDGATWWVL